MFQEEPTRLATDCSREFLELPPHEANARTIWDYWTAKAGERAAPSRSDIDPRDLPRLLPQILLVDVLRSPLRFRYRLSGSMADTIHGHPLRALFADEMEPAAFGSLLHADFQKIVETCRPHKVRLSFTNRDGQGRAYNVLRLPLVDENGEVNMILIFTNFGQ